MALTVEVKPTASCNSWQADAGARRSTTQKTRHTPKWLYWVYWRLFVKIVSTRTCPLIDSVRRRFAVNLSPNSSWKTGEDEAQSLWGFDFVIIDILFYYYLRVFFSFRFKCIYFHHAQLTNRPRYYCLFIIIYSCWVPMWHRTTLGDHVTLLCSVWHVTNNWSPMNSALYPLSFQHSDGWSDAAHI